MVKRCKIQLPIIRVSKPGFDVDVASKRNCLLHEEKLFAQPYFQTVVNAPAGGGVVNVAIPDVTSNPLVLIFPVFDGTRSVFPYPRSESSGTSQNGFPNLLGFDVSYRVISSTQIDVRLFVSPNTGNIASCYLVLMRRPS